MDNQENYTEQSSENESFYTPVKSIDEEFTRTNYRLNAQDFTEEQLLRREQDMKLMCQAYPTLNIGHAELIWNFVEREGKEKIQERIKSGIDEKPSTKYMRGGLLKTGRVYNKDEQDPLDAEIISKE